jgi:hypothetical protein
VCHGCRWVNERLDDSTTKDAGTSSRDGRINRAVENVLQRFQVNASDTNPFFLVNASIAYSTNEYEFHYRYRWLDGAVTCSTASILILFGVCFVLGDARSGSRWWSASFWCTALPPRPEKPVGSETTPLYKAPA